MGKEVGDCKRAAGLFDALYRSYLGRNILCTVLSGTRIGFLVGGRFR
jgi:hypothetical protein